MHTLEIPQANLKMEYPSSISELNSEQYFYFLGLVMQLKQKEINSFEFRLLLLYKLLNINMKKTNHPAVAENIARLAETMDSFLIDSEAEVREIYLYCIRSIIKHVEFKGVIYQAPDDVLSDCSFKQVTDARMFMQKMAEEQDDQYLTHIAAILLRPIQFNNFLDKKLQRLHKAKPQPYDMGEALKRVPDFETLPIQAKMAMYLLLRSTFDFLNKESELEVSGVKVQLKRIFDKGQKKGNAPSLGFTGVLFDLAESQLFGNLKETEETNFYLVILRMYDLILKADELKKKTPNASNKPTS